MLRLVKFGERPLCGRIIAERIQLQSNGMHRRNQPGVFDTTTRPIRIRLATLAASALLVLSLGSCGGGGGGGSGSYTIGGSVSGLAQGGQALLTLQWVNNAVLGSAVSVQMQVGNGPFSFSSQVPSGDSYAVVMTAPSGYTCTVANNHGTVTGNVGPVNVSCSALPVASIEVSVSGLTPGAQLLLLIPGFGPQQTITTNGDYSFQGPMALPANYYTVLDQPAGLSCTTTAGTGTISSTATVGISLSCSPISEYVYVLGCADYPNEGVGELGVGANGVATELSGNPYIGISQAACPTAVAADSTGHYLYVTGGGGLISQFKVETGGALTPLNPATVATGNGPQGVVADPAGQFVYVVNSTDNTVSQYSIGASGTLTPLSVPTVPTGNAPNAIALDPRGQYAYVLNSADNTVSQYSVGSGGALTPLSSPAVPTGAAPTAIVVDPSSHYVYAVNSVDDTVSQYAIGPGGALNPLSTPVVASGSGPTSIAADPTGPYVYVTNETSGTISEYRIGAGGALTLFNSIIVGAADLGVNAISVDPTGQYAYAAISGTGYEYSIGADGTLTPLIASATYEPGGGTSSSIAITKAN